MGKEYHIVYGEQAKDVLQKSGIVDFSKSNVQLILLQDNLNEGKLYDLKTLEGLENRTQWFEDFYGEDIWCEHRRANVKKCTLLLKKIQDNDQVYIWLGNDSSEYIWQSVVVDFLKEVSAAIYIVDWQNVISYNVHGQEINLDYLNICNPESVLAAHQNFRTLAKNEKQFFIELWNRILINNADIRNLNKGILVEGDVSFFDEMLINRCTNGFQKGALVVGFTLADMYFKFKSGGIGDSFLFKRLEQLAEMGKLEISDLIIRGRDYANLFNVRLK